MGTREASCIYQFSTNNQASFHLWWKENSIKHKKILIILWPFLQKVLFGLETYNFSKAFLFNKLTYKSLSLASNPWIHSSILILASLAPIVSLVNALLWRKMAEKVNLSVKATDYQINKWTTWSWAFWWVFKAG